MKVTIFTSNSLRHLSLINKISSISKECNAIVEVKTLFPGLNKDFFKKSKKMRKYFIKVDKAEKKYFKKNSHIKNHVNLKINDTIISSGFSSKFPENIPIGIISKIKTSPNDKFHKANILFFENFKELNHVMICRSSLMEEKKELELSNNE